MHLIGLYISHLCIELLAMQVLIGEVERTRGLRGERKIDRHFENTIIGPKKEYTHQELLLFCSGAYDRTYVSCFSLPPSLFPTLSPSLPHLAAIL